MPFNGPVAFAETGERRNGQPVGVLTAPLVYDNVQLDTLHVVVPPGYKFDGATLPPYVRWLLKPRDPRYFRASIIHDYMLDHRQFYTATRADSAFVAAAIEDGTPPWLAKLMMAAVKLHRFLFH